MSPPLHTFDNVALCKVAQNGCTTSVLKARANLHAVGDNGSCIRSDSDVFLVMLSPPLQSPPLRIPRNGVDNRQGVDTYSDVYELHS